MALTIRVSGTWPKRSWTSTAKRIGTPAFQHSAAINEPSWLAMIRSTASHPAPEVTLNVASSPKTAATALKLLAAYPSVTLDEASVEPMLAEDGERLKKLALDESGAPLEGAKIHTLRQGFGWGFSSTRRRGGVETDADGIFRLTGVAPGTLRLTVRADGYPRQVESVGEIAEGEILTDLEVVMRSGGVVTGTVVDPDGAPLEKASVWIRRDSDGGRIGSSVGSAEDGTFTIRGYRDVVSVRTQDYKSGELMASASSVYKAPDAPK